jgi:leucyl-tRNA synthetase
MMKFNHKEIESKWRRKWKKDEIYKATNKENKYYLLVELTYTSGDLHMGHWFAWCAPDAYARMKRMQGNNVLFPVGGFDAFGLPAENAAIKHGIRPGDWTHKNIENMRNQFEKMGPSFDWNKEVITCDTDYYRWTQWLFVQLYKKGLAYRGKVLSNWCPECKTVIANEHVENGCCWRHVTTEVEQKLVDQWLFRITDYADRLIWPKKPRVDWPQSAIEGQNNWIGRKEGISINYNIEGLGEVLECWTSRPDTNFGATFIVLAPEHPFVDKLASPQIKIPDSVKKEIKKYVKEAGGKPEKDRLAEIKDKSGVFTHLYAINELNGKKMPIWISDFVISSVGTGAVVGVPGHDVRDFEFAKQFGLEVVRVVVGSDGDKGEIGKVEQVQEEEGKMINSEFLDGLDIHKATEKMMDYLEEKGLGKRTVNYHLRDWSVSRRRYWAAPVPIIYCRKCWEIRNSKNTDQNRSQTGSKLKEGVDYTTIEGKEFMIHSVPEKDLPVTLPENVDYMPTGKAPLATAEKWMKVKCPACQGTAMREAETLDTYVDSSWYFFRYPNPHYDKGAYDKKIIDKWMPIKVYFGGPEHILGHTLYARFITKFLYDQGLIKFNEFAQKRIHHGVILGTDGYRMSKSRGNVVNPDVQVDKFGADSVRLYINFLGPHEKGGAWKTEGIEGSNRFLKRVWKLVSTSKDLIIDDKSDLNKLLSILHKTIDKVTKDIEILHTHTAIAAIMELTNTLSGMQKKYKTNRKNHSEEWNEAIKTLVKLLSPIAPYMMEELWVNVLDQKYSVHKSKWPQYDSKYVKEDMITIAVQVNGRLRAKLELKTQDSKLKGKVIEKAKENEKIKKRIGGKKIKKEIFVPGKLVNFVI